MDQHFLSAGFFIQYKLLRFAPYIVNSVYRGVYLCTSFTQRGRILSGPFFYLRKKIKPWLKRSQF